MINMFVPCPDAELSKMLYAQGILGSDTKQQ